MEIPDRRPRGGPRGRRPRAAWVRDFGQGRSFYTSLGHRDDIWSNDPVFEARVVCGIRWALGLEPGDATPEDDQ